MKFLADEDFPKPLVSRIRRFGHSVKTVQQQNLQGSSDETVASIAMKEVRILLTFDKGFLENLCQKLIRSFYLLRQYLSQFHLMNLVNFSAE